MFILKTDGGKICGGCPDDLVWTNEFEAMVFYDLGGAERAAEILRDRGLLVSVIPGPTPAEIYHKYVDLVRYKTHGMGLPHLVEEAESYLGLIIMTTWNRYDVRSCRRTTWIGKQVWGYLLDEREKTRRAWSRRESLLSHYVHRPNRVLVEMSDEAQIIIGMIRDDPDGCHHRFNRRDRRKKFENHLHDRGWSRDKVESVIGELKELIR